MTQSSKILPRGLSESVEGADISTQCVVQVVVYAVYVVRMICKCRYQLYSVESKVRGICWITFKVTWEFFKFEFQIEIVYLDTMYKHCHNLCSSEWTLTILWLDIKPIGFNCQNVVVFALFAWKMDQDPNARKDGDEIAKTTNDVPPVVTQPNQQVTTPPSNVEALPIGPQPVVDQNHEAATTQALNVTPAPTLRILRMRQPFKILTDIWGVLISFRFRKDLFRYIDDHLEEYLVKQYNLDIVQKWLHLLTDQTKTDKVANPEMPDLLELPTQAEVTMEDRQKVIKAVVENVHFRQKTKGLMTGIDYIFNQIWNDGYRNKTIRPSLFPDVVEAFRRWAGPPFQIKIYTFASGPWENQKQFLEASTDEITRYLTCGFDAFNSFKYESIRYRQVVSALTEREAKNLFYLTDSPTKATQARLAGLTVFVVRRDGNRHYRQEELDKFTCVDSLAQFDFYEFQ